ncbi:unnamed protein product [Pleuronectes platessa]|uniref:Uncharacterized protein n=1 Tax=Pleuronectes platessa TaxID=8262 RepID=A0A9N7ZCU9_PLEPL|nr:unnamed protein product [Pleuronectes platessa]
MRGAGASVRNGEVEGEQRRGPVKEERSGLFSLCCDAAEGLAALCHLETEGLECDSTFMCGKPCGTKPLNGHEERGAHRKYLKMISENHLLKPAAQPEQRGNRRLSEQTMADRTEPRVKCFPGHLLLGSSTCCFTGRHFERSSKVGPAALNRGRGSTEEQHQFQQNRNERRCERRAEAEQML